MTDPQLHSSLVRVMPAERREDSGRSQQCQPGAAIGHAPAREMVLPTPLQRTKRQMGMEVSRVRCVAEGEKGLAVTREFQNSTDIDFTEKQQQQQIKKNGNASGL